MLFNIKRSAFSPGSFSYTGDTDYKQEGYTWELALLSSGTLTLNAPVVVDIFMIEAGKDGNDAEGHSTGGRGGDGGKYRRLDTVSLAAGDYTAVVGASNGATTSFGSYSIPNDAPHTTGGLGAQAGPAGERNPGDGEDGVLPYASGSSLLYPGRLFGASGGGGAAHATEAGQHNNNMDMPYPAGSPGSKGGSGGSYDEVPYLGGGDGGKCPASGEDGTVKSGHPAGENSGAGGGGECRYRYQTWYTDGYPGAGGSGIILIRPHKEVHA